MPLSDDKISHLAHHVVAALTANARLLTEEVLVLREVKRVLQEESQMEERVDEAVRRKLRSYSRPIPEGSSEWDVLYRKFYGEEMDKIAR